MTPSELADKIINNRYQPAWYRRKDWVAEHEVNAVTTLYYRKRCNAMDTVWWYMTGQKIL